MNVVSIVKDLKMIYGLNDHKSFPNFLLSTTPDKYFLTYPSFYLMYIMCHIPNQCM